MHPTVPPTRSSCPCPATDPEPGGLEESGSRPSPQINRINRGRRCANYSNNRSLEPILSPRHLVAVTEKGEEIGLIISNVKKQLRRSGDSPLKGPYESQQVPADDSRQRSRTGHLNLYYDAVIACIGDAESILIFGPGEAKGELKKRLGRNNLGKRIAGVETVDKMTNRQIAAKVRQHFAEKRSVKGSRRDHLTDSSSGHGKPLKRKRKR